MTKARTLWDFRALLGEDPDPEVSTPSRVLSEAYDEIVRLRAEVTRLQRIQRAASQRLRAISGAPNAGPKSLLDYVGDVEGGVAKLCSAAEKLESSAHALARGDGASDGG